MQKYLKTNKISTIKSNNRNWNEIRFESEIQEIDNLQDL